MNFSLFPGNDRLRNSPKYYVWLLGFIVLLNIQCSYSLIASDCIRDSLDLVLYIIIPETLNIYLVILLFRKIRLKPA